MPFLASFTCLWCGAAHATRGPDDLEGWAQLCPDCLGRAGENPFLRFRLRDALAERAGAAKRAGPMRRRRNARRAPRRRPRLAAPDRAAAPATWTPTMVAYYEARAGEYDDWYLRRGRYSHGPIDDMAWRSDLDTAGRWLDELGLGGRIVELATGTGWWSPLLAGRGELWCYDAAEAPLELARQRLVAHDLRAHLHVRDAWAEPEFAGRRAVHGLLAQPRPAAAPRRVPRARPALARARRPPRVHRLAPRPVVVGASTTGRGPT